MPPSAALLLCLGIGLAAAPAPAAVAPPIEAVNLMDVEGSLVIGADGSVEQVDVATGGVTPALREALQSKAKRWAFEPIRIGGAPARARASFRLTVSATPDPSAAGRFHVRVDGASFGNIMDKSAVLPDGALAPILPGKMRRPDYPVDLQSTGRSGRVMLAILVSPDGRAEKVQVLQSLAFDLTGRQHVGMARSAIAGFERSAAAAARRWTFTVPPDMATRSPSERTVIAPVEYLLAYDTLAAGYWVPVQRGPRRPIAWLPEASLDTSALGASGNAMASLDSPYKLRQPAAGTTLQ